MMVHDVLFELGTEELPSGAVLPLGEALASHLAAAFLKAGITHGQVDFFCTPRRLAVIIQKVADTQPSQTVSRRGPATSVGWDVNGQPTPALQGFAKSCGVSVDQLTTVKTDKGEWWSYESVSAGLLTKELLPSMVSEAIAALPIAKPMRWGDGDVLFARPVHWAVLLLGEQVVSSEVLGVTTGRKSYGHRFHHPQSVSISSPKAYESLLNEAFVIADFAARRQLVVDQIHEIATSRHYTAVMPDFLVDEVTSIVEWPEALLANFDKAFLEVPAEALIAALQSHQKCFALRDQQGKLLPHFITVANISSQDPKQVVMGNEKVVHARLSDAAFFYHQDKRQTLSQYQSLTSQVVFQAKLGTLQDKANRVQALMEYLAGPLELDQKQARRAAELSQCDLMTGMVGEFPELQGLMGYYYALHDGEDEAVAEALNEQYMPRFAADELPKSTLGLALSLANRMDTLVGAFAIGQKPTGVKDPFKLRRHALAMIRLFVLTPVALNVSTLIDVALRGYGQDFKPADGSIEDIKPFILDRLPSFYQSQGIVPELVLAVRARQDDWLFDMDKRIHALISFQKLSAATSLSAACKRVNNLLQHASGMAGALAVDKTLFVESAEKELFKSVQSMEEEMMALYSAGDYKTILTRLADLREPIDSFFEQVMVMVDDPALKENRLNLLSRLQSMLLGVADISLLS